MNMVFLYHLLDLNSLKNILKWVLEILNRYIKVYIYSTNCMEKEFFIYQREKNMKVNGKIIKWMVKEYLHFLIMINMKEILKMIFTMDKENLHGF